LVLGKIISKIADLGSKKAGLTSDFWENCMILKKISIGKRPFFGVCYTSRKITEDVHVRLVNQLVHFKIHQFINSKT
jgi:hypothetical protein